MSQKTNLGLVSYVRRALSEGWVYWYGTTGQKCTEDLLTRKAKQYPEHYGESRMATYRRHIAQGRKCADCINLVKGYLWLNEANGRQGYASNGVPDYSADRMFELASVKGPIDSLPELPGLIVRFPGHAGVYIGNGLVIEARGFSSGVMQTSLVSRPWTHWYRMPGLIYEGDIPAEPETTARMEIVYRKAGGAAETRSVSFFFARVLKRGMDGEDVRLMQESLRALGYDLPRFGADGEFGEETEQAVRAFQSEHKLTADGEFGPLSTEAMNVAWK